MKKGYGSELDGAKNTLQVVKTDLEALYAAKLDMADGSHKARFDEAIAASESAIMSYNGTCKTIKLAIDSTHQRAEFSTCCVFDLLFT